MRAPRVALALGAALAAPPAAAEWSDVVVATARCPEKVAEAMDRWEPAGCADPFIREAREKIRRRAQFALREGCYIHPERHILLVGAKEQQENTGSARTLLTVSSSALLPLAAFTTIGCSVVALSGTVASGGIVYHTISAEEDYRVARSLEPFVETNRLPEITSRDIFRAHRAPDDGTASKVLAAVESLIERYQARHLQLSDAQSVTLGEAEERRSIFSLGADRTEILQILEEQKEAHGRLYELEAKELLKLDRALFGACERAAEVAGRDRPETSSRGKAASVSRATGSGPAGTPTAAAGAGR